MKNMTFSRYAPFIREYIYRKGWTDLREVQIKACEAILDTDKHVIIASGTASGKTEAAFFPVLTVLENEVSNSIGVLYIGPLKALINDQFQRLNELLRDCDINVWPWHGDIVGSKKERAIRDASGVMQITPESLESLLMRRTNDVKKLFNDLKFVVIDEIHVFMGEDRGLQLLCLLKRLEQIANCSPRRIGLSATLHDYESAKAFLSAGTEREVIAVGVEGCNRRAIIGVECYKFPEDIGERDQTLNLYNQFLYTQCYDKKCLTFTNSRSEAEMFVYDMKNIAQTRKEPDVFYAHHGSVTSLLRERAEQKMKSASGPIVTAATKTLELGVDIGDLDLIIQLGAPNTCSSFVQRLGRSGRRSGRSKMLFVESFSEHCDKPLECIPWELLQTIAIIQLYREEKWIEPFEVKEKPYSLLVHQTLALLMQNGATKPSNLGRMVLSLPPFQNKITVREYGKILKYMLKINMLEKLDDGYLIIGNAGEQVCNHYSFYAIFPDKEEYRVISKDGLIGSIDEVPNVGENFALAGEIWRVIEINCFKKTISVVAGTGRGMGYWKGGGAG